MVQSDYMLILRTNSYYVQMKLELSGIHTCPCCNFKDVIWLECILNPEYKGPINGVHGLGNSDEDHLVFDTEINDYVDPRRNGDPHNDYLVSKSICMEVFTESKPHYPVIDCGYNVDYFIKLIKDYERRFK